MTRIGILGGTFDPVHNAHLEVARSCKQQLDLDELRLIPCWQSPTRDRPQVSPEHRLAMLQAAVSDEQDLIIDDRELKRTGRSYSVDTLRELRNEHEDAMLFFIVGVDAFNGLLEWKQWQALFELAHIVIVGRPGDTLVAEGELADVLAERQVTEMPASKAGAIVKGPDCPLFISASEVRARVHAGEPAQQLLPGAVWHYIQQHRFYQ